MGLSTAGSREINVTPLIDVLLVLLIIFLVAIPILLPAEPIAIPPTEADVVPEPALTLRVDPDLSVSFDDGPPFPGRELATRLRGQLPRVGAVFVDAGEGVPWKVVVSTVDTVRGVAGDVRHGMTVGLRVHDR